MTTYRVYLQSNHVQVKDRIIKARTLRSAKIQARKMFSGYYDGDLIVLEKEDAPSGTYYAHTNKSGWWFVSHYG